MAQVPDGILGQFQDEVAQTRLPGILGGRDGPGGRLGATPNFFSASTMQYSAPEDRFGTMLFEKEAWDGLIAAKRNINST